MSKLSKELPSSMKLAITILVLFITSLNCYSQRDNYWDRGLHYHTLDSAGIRITASLQLAESSLDKYIKLNLYVSKDSIPRVLFDETKITAKIINRQSSADYERPRFLTDSAKAYIISPESINSEFDKKMKTRAFWGTLGAVASTVAGITSESRTDQVLGAVGAAGFVSNTALLVANDVKYRNLIYDDYIKRTTLEPGRVAVGYLLLKPQVPPKGKYDAIYAFKTYGRYLEVTFDFNGELFSLRIEIDNRLELIDINRL